MIKNRMGVIFISGIVFLGCRSLKSAEEAYPVSQGAAEESNAVFGQIEAIKEKAQSVDYSNGVDEVEARALVEKYILDRYPQFLGWSIKIYSQNDKWMAICRASVHHFDMVEVDKNTGKVRYLENNFGNVNFLKEQPSD